MVSSALSIRGLSAASWPPMLQRLVWVTAGLGLSVLPHIAHIRPWILLLAAINIGRDEGSRIRS